MNRFPNYRGGGTWHYGGIREGGNAKCWHAGQHGECETLGCGMAERGASLRVCSCVCFSCGRWLGFCIDITRAIARRRSVDTQQLVYAATVSLTSSPSLSLFLSPCPGSRPRPCVLGLVPVLPALAHGARPRRSPVATWSHAGPVRYSGRGGGTDR